MAAGLAAAGLMAAASAYSAYQQKKAVEEAARAEAAGGRAARAANYSGYKDVEAMMSPYTEAGKTGLGALTQGIYGGDFETPVEDFQYQGQVSDFLDPSTQFQQDRMASALEASAAASGGLYSGGFAKALQDRSGQIAQTDYGNSYNRMMQDKTFAYNQFNNNFNQRRQENAASYNRLAGLVNMGAGAQGNVASARSGVAMANANIAQDIGASNAAAAAAPYQALSSFGAQMGSPQMIGLGMQGYNQMQQDGQGGQGQQMNPYNQGFGQQQQYGANQMQQINAGFNPRLAQQMGSI